MKISKKLISFLLITIFIVTLTGCNSKNQSYFNDVKEITTNNQNTFEISVKDINTDKDSLDKDIKEQKFILSTDNNHNYYFAIKNKKNRKKPLLEIIYSDNYIYTDLRQVSKYISPYLGQSDKSLKGKVKINLKKIAPGENWNNKNFFKNKEELKSFIDHIVEALNNNYSNILCEFGNQSAIKIDSTNIEKALDDTKAFLKNDYKNLYKESQKLTKTKQTDEKAINIYINEILKNYSEYKKEIIKYWKEKKVTFLSIANTKDNIITIILNYQNKNTTSNKNTNNGFTLDIKKTNENINIKSKISKKYKDITSMFEY